jgi:hypothetical protein
MLSSTPESEFDAWFESERASSIDYDIEDDVDDVEEDSYEDEPEDY